jgi:hypothetical protein
MFVHPLRCAYKDGCFGRQAMRGINNGVSAEDAHPAFPWYVKERIEAPFIHTGGADILYNETVETGICAHCAVARGDKVNASFLEVDEVMARTASWTSLAFADQYQDPAWVNENTTPPIFNAPPRSPQTLARLESKLRVEHEARVVVTDEARAKRASLVIIDANGMKPVSSVMKSGSDLTASATEAEAYQNKVDEIAARSFYAPSTILEMSPFEQVILPRPYIDCRRIYRRTVDHLNEHFEKINSDATLQSPTSPPTIESLAMIIATSIASGRHVFITNEFLDERGAFAATKRAAEIMDAVLEISINRESRATDFYYSQDVGLPEDERWTRQTYVEDALTIRVARMTDKKVHPRLKTILDYDQRHVADRSGQSRKNCRFVLTGISRSDCPENADAIILDRGVTADTVAKIIESSPLWKDDGVVAGVGASLARLLRFVWTKNPSRPRDPHQSSSLPAPTTETIIERIRRLKVSETTATDEDSKFYKTYPKDLLMLEKDLITRYATWEKNHRPSPLAMIMMVAIRDLYIAPKEAKGELSLALDLIIDYFQRTDTLRQVDITTIDVEAGEIPTYWDALKRASRAVLKSLIQERADLVETMIDAADLDQPKHSA